MGNRRIDGPLDELRQRLNCLSQVEDRPRLSEGTLLSHVRGRHGGRIVQTGRPFWHFEELRCGLPGLRAYYTRDRLRISCLEEEQVWNRNGTFLYVAGMGCRGSINFDKRFPTSGTEKAEGIRFVKSVGSVGR